MCKKRVEFFTSRLFKNFGKKERERERERVVSLVN